MSRTFTPSLRLLLVPLGLALSALLWFGLAYGNAANWMTPSVTTSAARSSTAHPTPEASITPSMLAQSGGGFNITQSVIAGGGGTSTGGALSLSGTVGQSALGTSTGGAFSLTGGFWQSDAPCSAPSVTLQPTAQTVCAGAAASFSVNATGSNLSYQWRKNGTPLSNGGNISGATTAQLTINPALAADAASYDVVITGQCGSPATSNAAPLTVNTYSLASMSQSFAAAGGTSSVNVTVAGACPWTAVSNDAWITINSGTSGAGNGTVNYTVAANSGSARSGTMTIAGLTFTVNQSSPTAIELLSLQATAYDGGTLIEWRTGAEVANLGFRLHREAGGKRELVTPQMVAGSALRAGSDLMSGESYAWWDEAASPQASYWLEDIDLNGQATWRGPFAAQALGGKAPTRALSAALGAIAGHPPLSNATRAVEPVAAAHRPSPAQLVAQAMLAGQAALKIEVRCEGWYRISQAELAAAGFDAGGDPRLLQLFADGEEVPMIVSSGKGDRSGDSAIEFYGTGLDTPSTDTRTYWLVAGKQPGRRVEMVKGDGVPGAATSFVQTVERRDRTIYFAALRNGEAENFFGAVVAAEPVEQRLELRHLAASSSPATVEVTLQGVTGLPHRVGVQLNGTSLGEIIFNHQQPGTGRFEVAASRLREGANVILLTAAGGPGDVSLVDRIRISYPHTFTADDDALTLNMRGGERVAIGGFTSRAVRAFDVTEPGAPRELVAEVTGGKGGYTVNVAAAEGGERRVLVTATERLSQAARLTVNEPSEWRMARHEADLVILTRRDWFDELRPLVELREAAGLKVAMVDVEDVFDEFNGGNRSPQAVKDFLAYARTNWARGPRYVLLVGDASVDPRDYLGFGANDLVPTQLVDTAYLETASDDWLADFDGDGISDLAFGRLPVRTAAEAEAAVAKLRRYEQAATPEAALLVADRNEGYDFEAASAALRGWLPGLRVEELRRGQVEAEAAKKSLLAALTGGERMVNYMGHGSATAWNGQLLTSTEAATLANPSLPVFVMMNCLNGYFADPAGEALGEALVKARWGGAVAVWASTGMTAPEAQTEVNREFYRRLLGGRGVTLGEAARLAKAVTQDPDVRRTWVLLGDPTMRLR